MVGLIITVHYLSTGKFYIFGLFIVMMAGVNPVGGGVCNSPSRNKQISDQWGLITELVGPAKLWPPRVRRLFWTKNIVHFDRFLVCCFAWVNGLDPKILFEWVELLGLCRDRAARQHMENLFKYFEEGRYDRRYYAYNVSFNNYFWLDGTIRRYVHKSKRDQ